MISTSVRNSMPALRLGPGLDHFNQLQNIAGGGIAVVDDKIAMHGRNHGPAPARAFQTQFVDQFARRTRSAMDF